MQQEIITRSGVVIRYNDSVSEVELGKIDFAIRSLGGVAAIGKYDENRETVLQIMDQNVVGTTLTDNDGHVYALTSAGWTIQDDKASIHITLPPYEHVCAATMPGGWSWAL